MRFILTGGQAGDSPQGIPVLSGIKATHVIADREYDREVYKQRNLNERASNKLKNWRRIATRYDRRSLYFMATLQLASAITWST